MSKEQIEEMSKDLSSAPVGEWIPYEDSDGYGYGYEETTWYKCSACGGKAHGRCQDEWYSYPVRSNFCPHCGAKMKGEESND